MSRYFAFGNVLKLAHSILAKQRANISGFSDNGRRYMVGLPYTFYRLCLQHHILNKRYSSCKLLKASNYSSSNTTCNSFYALSASNAVSHHAQIARRRLYCIPTFTGAVLSPLSRIAYAVTFALARSHVVHHGLFAVVFGNLVWTNRSWAEAEAFPVVNSLYTQARNGHIDLTSILYSLLEGAILFLRAVYLIFLFTPCISMAPFADSLGVEYRKRWLRVVHQTLEKAGPAFIKWGQWAATRPDLFASDICNELAKLHSKAPAHSYAYSKITIEKAFGRNLHDIFEKFEEEPVASGSVAQVHRATLQIQYPDRDTKPILVAVKVRHPGVGEAIRRDFALINLVAKVSKFMPTLNWLRLDESIQQFAVFMMSQVDLAREAANLSRFIYNFRRCKDVSFPKPLYPLVHPSVLVETFEHGESVSHYVDELEGNESIKSALARIGTHALLKMLLVDNFVHADMHPGNILIRESRNTGPSTQLFKLKPHVIFLDVGMTAELSRRDRITLLDYFKAVVLRDGRAAAECTLKLSKLQKCPNPEAFIKEVEQTFSYWDSREGGLFHPGECMQQILEQVRRHRVNIDGNVCTVMVTMLVLEGWQRKLDPEYDVMHALQTLLFKADLAESLTYTIEGLMAP